MKPTTVWIAVSEYGHPAPFIGYAFTRKRLVETYELLFGHSPKAAGYRLVKVQLSEVPPARTPFKLKVTKAWIARMAQLEEGHEVSVLGAGKGERG